MMGRSLGSGMIRSKWRRRPPPLPPAQGGGWRPFFFWGPGAPSPPPHPRPPVAAVADKLGKLAVRHRSASDGEGFDFDFVRPLLVVEDQELPRRRSEQKLPARDLDVDRT